MPERPAFEITAVAAGKCQCCNSPYEKGDRLRKEGRYWVLIEHNPAEQPRAQRPGLRDQFLMGRRNNTQG
jgi:hypothetical protein